MPLSCALNSVAVQHNSKLSNLEGRAVNLKKDHKKRREYIFCQLQCWHEKSTPFEVYHTIKTSRGLGEGILFFGMGQGQNLQWNFSGLNAAKITTSLRENEKEDFTRLTSKELVH